MNENNAVYLAGYWFACEASKTEEGQTEITMSISGDGTAARDFDAWALELCCSESEDAKVAQLLSCEMRRAGGAWLPASAQQISPDLADDIGFPGVMIEEGVGKDEEDASFEFRLTFEGSVGKSICAIAYIFGDTVVRSRDKLMLFGHTDCCEDKIWQTPVTKSFCMYVVVPEGYKPQSPCKTGLSVLRRGMFLHCEAGVFNVECECGNEAVMTSRVHLTGVVKITASVPLKSRHASGDTAWSTACDCFELDETIGYVRDTAAFALRDISIRPKKGSVDLTLLNAHCGKSVYRLDGEFTIHCKRCVSRDLE